MLRIASLAVMLVLVANASAEQVALVAVMNGQDALPHRKTQESFESSLRQTGRVEFLPVAEDGSVHGEERPALVFALGSVAVKRSRETFGDRPLLATMILSTASLGNTPEATAVLLKPSAEQQLEWHRRFLPRARRVGVLYNPDESQVWVDEAETAAAKMNLDIVAIPVRTPRELPAALKSLARRADSILGIPDKVVYSPKTAKAILLFSFRNRIPFVGMSDAWVRAGALYGIDWDYEELGRQCASVALRIIDGANAATIEPQSPEKLVYQVNLKTANQLKLEISDELIAAASEVYR